MKQKTTNGNLVFGLKTENRFYCFGNLFLNLFFYHFHQENYQMLDKINSDICLMLSVYKSFQNG